MPLNSSIMGNSPEIPEILKKKSSLTITQIHVTSSSIVVFLFFLFISMLITSRGLIIGIYPLMFGLN